MAQYLIVAEDSDGTVVKEITAKTMTEAARTLDAHDGFTATIWRVAGPPKTITMQVFTKIAIDVSDE